MILETLQADTDGSTAYATLDLADISKKAAAAALSGRTLLTIADAAFLSASKAMYDMITDEVKLTPKNGSTIKVANDVVPSTAIPSWRMPATGSLGEPYTSAVPVNAAAWTYEAVFYGTRSSGIDVLACPPADGAGSGYALYLAITSGGAMTLYRDMLGSTSRLAFTGAGWRNGLRKVMVTFSAAGGLKMYRDGVMVASAVDANVLTDTALQLFGQGVGNSSAFTGHMVMQSLFDRDLSLSASDLAVENAWTVAEWGV